MKITQIITASISVVIITLAAYGIWDTINTLRQPDAVEALLKLENAVIQSPRDAKARVAVATAYASIGRDQDALEQFENALLLDKHNQTALAGIEELRAQDAVAVAANLGENDNLPETTSHSVTPSMKTESAASIGYGWSDINGQAVSGFTVSHLMESSIPAEVTTSPTRDLAASASNLGMTDGQTIVKYYELGLIHAERNEFAQAAELFQKAVDLNSLDADALYRLGEAQRLGTRFEEALTSFRKAVRLVPNYTAVYQGMLDLSQQTGDLGLARFAEGMINLTAHDFGAAVKRLGEAANIAPDMAEVHEGLAVALDATGEGELAQASYAKALELDETLFLARIRLHQ